LRGKTKTDDEIDMTPMIDCVFQLLIFFLVGSTPDVKTEVMLPPAHHGVAVDPGSAMILTLADSGSKEPALVYLADGKVGSPLAGEPATQEAMVTQAVEKANREGINMVLIKAERSVRHRDVSRIASAATQVQGIKLELAIQEKD
jgi:biopolymer transport protein ExbD